MKAVTDIETGGYSKEKNGICEIGMIAINENNLEVDSLSILIKPYKRPVHLQDFPNELVSYKDSAMSVNGLTVDQLTDGVDPFEACNMIEDFIIKNNITSFIGQNIEAFDKKWLLYFFSRFSDYDLTIIMEVVDCTMKIAKDKLDLKSYSLSSLCDEFGIVNDSSHRSIGDCRATLEVYKKLIKT